MRQLKHFADAERREIVADVAALHPGYLAIDKTNLKPAFGVLRSIGNCFETRLPGKLENGRMLRDIRLAVNVGTELRDADRLTRRRIETAVERLQIRRGDPARIAIRGANVDPARLDPGRKHARSIERLRDHITRGRRAAVHVDDGLGNYGIGVIDRLLRPRRSRYEQHGKRESRAAKTLRDPAAERIFARTRVRAFIGK